jgi:hypothetical protein
VPRCDTDVAHPRSTFYVAAQHISSLGLLQLLAAEFGGQRDL